MNHGNIFTMSALAFLTTTMGLAQITLPAPIQVNSPIITINGSPGDQTDPHVDKDLASYTDVPSNQVRYYRFSTGADLAIPQDATTFSTSCLTQTVATLHSAVSS